MANACISDGFIASANFNLDHSQPTFIHAIQELVEVFSLIIILVFLPCLSILTSQHDQLALLAPQRAKMGDLHNDWPGGRQYIGAFSEEFTRR